MNLDMLQKQVNDIKKELLTITSIINKLNLYVNVIEENIKYNRDDWK